VPNRKRWQSLRDTVIRTHETNVEEGTSSESVQVQIGMLAPAVLEGEVDDMPVDEDEDEESTNDVSSRHNVKAGKARASEAEGEDVEDGAAEVSGGGDDVDKEAEGEDGVEGDGEDEKVDDDHVGGDGEGGNEDEGENENENENEDEDEEERNNGEPREKKNRRYLPFDARTHFFWEESVRYALCFFLPFRLTYPFSAPTVPRRNGFVSATFTMRMASLRRLANARPA
jgi:hypothetical protein